MTEKAARVNTGKRRMRNRVSSMKKREWINAYIFILPALLVIACFCLYPAIRLFYMSCNNFGIYEGVYSSRFVGLKNFKWIFEDSTFWKTLWNTFYFPLVITPIQTAIALGMALLLNKQKRFKNFFRTVYFIPVVMSYVIVATFWKNMMNTEFGTINQILGTLGIKAIPFLSNKNLSKGSIAAVAIWKSWAWYMVIFMTAIESIPESLYEAASIDGANASQRFRYITLPQLRKTFLFVIIISTMNCIKLFTPIMVMTDGGPADSSRVIVHYIWTTAFMYNDYGSAAAMSVILFAIVLLISIIQFKVIDQKED